ncbi:MAG TPA: TIGR03618 family F420-dependent PPOX class oxidoreductase [Jatrophihabitantaceae bacterium]|jgi:PPOX class probable F420-dependent enzyme|nr:TIGR03618 family F420-dependent PPOX class oxidoreductase [Jatrophihabitantaceae bacterium]
MPKPPVPAEFSAVLANPNPCVIGLVKENGAPITVATWYLWEDGRVLVNMDEGRKRLDYLRVDPRVSLTMLDGDRWYRSISLRGRVASLTDDPDLSTIDRLARHFTGRPYRNRTRGRVSAWIDVEQWYAWGFR